MTVHVATQIFFAFIALYLFLKGKRLLLQWDKALAVTMIATGWPHIFHSLGGIIMNLSDRLILEKMTDLATVGIYSLGANLGVATLIFCNAVNNKWGAWMYKQMKNPTEADKIKIVRYTYIYFGATLCVGVAIALLGTFYTRFFIGEAFQDAIPIIAWIAAGSTIYGMAYLVTNYIIILGKISLLAKITGSAAGLNIILTILMVDKYGAVGAAQATFTVPLNPDFSSLNLSQAVLLIAYEFMIQGDKTPEVETHTGKSDLANRDNVMQFTSRLIESLENRDFFKSGERRPTIERSLNNLFLRHNWTEQDLKTLHGILSALVKDNTI